MNQSVQINLASGAPAAATLWNVASTPAAPQMLVCGISVNARKALVIQSLKVDAFFCETKFTNRLQLPGA